MAKKLTESQVRRSLRFGAAVSATAGQRASKSARSDAEKALRGEISFDEAVRRAAVAARR